MSLINNSQTDLKGVIFNNDSVCLFNNRIEPILRWAGGKRKIVDILLKYLPEDLHERAYREPFLGAGSLFFSLCPHKAYLSDANEHLIECYKSVRDNPVLVNTYIQKHLASTCKEYYYQIREQYNNSRYSATQAARFIYLNKTCFNGIFRVNKQGKFNVPYGWKEPPSLPSVELLEKTSDALSRSNLAAQPFEESLKNVESDEFVYLDPPYPPLNGTSFFTHYTVDRFGTEDQCHLAEMVNNMASKGCKFMMSNADTPLIRELYRDFKIFDLSVTRYITCKSKRHKVSELVITNYNPYQLT